MNKKGFRIFTTLEGNTLMAQEFPPLRFAVEKNPAPRPFLFLQVATQTPSTTFC